MTLKYRTEGIVFKKDEIGEFDQNFSVFTKDFGRLDLTAKAIRKITSKLRRDFDIFYLSEIEFIQGKNRKTLTDAIAIKKPKIDLERIEFFGNISEVLNNFIRGEEKDIKIFDLLIETFENSLKIENCKLKIAFHYFFWNFISLQGYKMEVDNCALCHGKLNSAEVYFSAKDGGAICKNCLAPTLKQKINADAVKILRLIFNKDWQTISKLKVSDPSQKLLESISQTAVHTFCPLHC